MVTKADDWIFHTAAGEICAVAFAAPEIVKAGRLGGRRRPTLRIVGSEVLSLHFLKCKETVMDVSARITSKGQVTIPRSVREALNLREGDEVVFRVEESRAVLLKTPDFLSLAGSVPVPAGKRGTPWDDVLQRTRRLRAETRR